MPTVSRQNLSVLETHARETEAAMQRMQNNKLHLPADQIPYFEKRYEFQKLKLQNIRQIQHDVRKQLEWMERQFINKINLIEGEGNG